RNGPRKSVQTATLIAAGISRFEVTTKRKPFDFFVERLPLEKSRGNKTPIELLRPPISEIRSDLAGLIRDATPDFKRSSSTIATKQAESSNGL
ncbi:MAG: hypothetical protein ACK5YO_18175, partial [Planctomyces sp.]